MCKHEWILISEHLENGDEINSGIDFEETIVQYYYCTKCGISSFHDRYGIYFSYNSDSDTD